MLSCWSKGRKDGDALREYAEIDQIALEESKGRVVNSTLLDRRVTGRMTYENDEVVGCFEEDDIMVRQADKI